MFDCRHTSPPYGYTVHDTENDTHFKVINLKTVADV